MLKQAFKIQVTTKLSFWAQIKQLQACFSCLGNGWPEQTIEFCVKT